MTHTTHATHAPPRPRRARLTTVAALPFLLLAAESGAQGATRTNPELPRQSVDTRLPAAPGRTIRVSAGDNLQRAIDRARPGDVLALAPGATFRGRFTLPEKDGDGWITIRTAGDDGLPRPGERITPAAAPRLARIVAVDGEAALRTEPRAHHYRVMLLEVTAEPSVKRNGGLVRLGASGKAQSTLAAVPHHLILDRVYVHGHDAMHLKRCVSLNAAWAAVIDSYLSECHGKGQDTQAILGWNGPGPFKIENNRLEGAAENVMFGGSDPTIPNLVPSDIEIRRNHILKPREWAGRWTVKNLLELKNAQRVLVEGNVLESVWPAGQNGFAILVKSVNQDGRCTWCVVRHVTIRNNVVRDAAGGVNLAGAVNRSKKKRYWPGEFLNNVLIENNEFTDIGTGGPDYAGRLFQVLDSVWNITIAHNTGQATKFAIMPIGAPKRNVHIIDNVFGRTRYGIKGQGATVGTATLAKYFPGGTFAGNVVVDGKAKSFPARNHFPGRGQAVAGFKGSDGRLAGADLRALSAATRGVDR